MAKTYSAIKKGEKDSESRALTLVGVFVGMSFLLLVSTAVFAVLIRRINYGGAKSAYTEEYLDEVCEDAGYRSKIKQTKLEQKRLAKKKKKARVKKDGKVSLQFI